MSRPSSRRLALIAAAVGALASAAVAGAASPLSGALGSECGSTSAVFAPWGDSSQYVFTTSGGFENGAAGWSFDGGARIVAGNEPFDVHAATDAASLLLQGGASAVSPATCFGLLTPNIRFFARSAGGAEATVHVQVIAQGLLGALTVLDGGSATVGPNWAPTPVFSTLLSQLDAPLGTTSIQIEISATSGSAQVDDIYIDPFVSH